MTPWAWSVPLVFQARVRPRKSNVAAWDQRRGLPPCKEASDATAIPVPSASPAPALPKGLSPTFLHPRRIPSPIRQSADIFPRANRLARQRCLPVVPWASHTDGMARLWSVASVNRAVITVQKLQALVILAVSICGNNLFVLRDIYVF